MIHDDNMGTRCEAVLMGMPQNIFNETYLTLIRVPSESYTKG